MYAIVHVSQCAIDMKTHWPRKGFEPFDRGCVMIVMLKCLYSINKTFALPSLYYSRYQILIMTNDLFN